MRSFDIHPELSKASTLPSWAYTSQERLDDEQKSTFTTTWQLVGKTQDLPELNTFFTTRVGEEPIVVTRSAQNQLHAFSNVCRHRAGPVARGCGKTTFLRCAYHAWVYNLNGSLARTPEFENVENFDIKEVTLPQWQLKTWGPLIFVSRNPLMPFEEWIGEIPFVRPEYSLNDIHFLMTKDYPVESNWKVYVDNYLEGYHIGPVHPKLAGELDYGRYEVKTYKWYSEQIAPARDTGVYYSQGSSPGAHYFWLFPNLMLNIYQGLVQTNLVIPAGPDKCVVRFEWYGFSNQISELKPRLGELIEFSDLIQAEDAQICRDVQKNLRSQDYDRGRFSVKRENGVHHFHRLLASQK